METSMRTLIVAATLTALAQGAWAQETKVKGDPSAVPDAGTSAEAEAISRLRVLLKKLQEAGFTDVQIVPQAVLIQAKDKSDKPIVMIVDTLTMMAVEIRSPLEGETTGNGPSEDADRR
jgi:hypothetical protein